MWASNTLDIPNDNVWNGFIRHMANSTSSSIKNQIEQLRGGTAIKRLFSPNNYGISAKDMPCDIVVKLQSYLLSPSLLTFVSPELKYICENIQVKRYPNSEGVLIEVIIPAIKVN